MESNGIENAEKNVQKYSCECCDVHTFKKTDFARHCETIKHKTRLMESKGIEKYSRKIQVENLASLINKLSSN
jgi:hypothetical protein